MTSQTVPHCSPPDEHSTLRLDLRHNHALQSLRHIETSATLPVNREYNN